MVFFDEKSGASIKGDPSVFADSFIVGSEQFRIKDLEEKLLHTEEKDERISLLKALAHNYTTCLLGIPEPEDAQTVDIVSVFEPTIKHILDYYYKAYQLGDIHSLYMHGNLLILFYATVDEGKYTLGLYELCVSYTKGFSDAKEALQQHIDDGFVSGFKSADEIIKLYIEA